MLPLRTKCMILIVAFVCGMAVNMLAVVSDGMIIRFLDRAEAGLDVSEEEGNDHDARQATVALVQTGVFLVTAVVFLVWFYAAHKNLGRAGLKYLSYSPGWAVGGFFVPFLNLVRPYQVMKEVDVGSAALSGDRTLDPRNRPQPSPLVGLWWGVFLLSSFTGNLAGRLYAGAKEPNELRNALIVMLASDALEIGAAVLAVILVRRVTNLQENARTANSAIAAVFS